MREMGAELLEEAFARVGGRLEREGGEAAVVIAGGASLVVQGMVRRTTRDVDVLALRVRDEAGGDELVPPDPCPDPLRRAIEGAAAELGLAPDWMNFAAGTVGQKWRAGLPPGLAERVSWRRYGALEVGLLDRVDLIFLKMYAAASHAGAESVHYQDLIALSPTGDELRQASAWARRQGAAGPLL